MQVHQNRQKNKMTFFSYSTKETMEIGKNLVSKIGKSSVIAVYGDFGAGKTVLVKGIAKALKCQETVKSPSFIFMHKYNGIIPLYHIDLYRAKSKEDILTLGINEFFYKDGICVIEWAEKAENFLPTHKIDVKIEIINEKTRKIEIKKL